MVLTEENLEAVKKAAAVLQIPDVSLIGDGKGIYLTVRDKKNSGSNSYKIEVGEARPESFFSSLTASFLAVAPLSFVASCPFLETMVYPFCRVFLSGDGDSSSTLVGDLCNYSLFAEPSINAKVLSLKSNLIISLISLANS